MIKAKTNMAHGAARKDTVQEAAECPDISRE